VLLVVEKAGIPEAAIDLTPKQGTCEDIQRTDIG
jgi:hypothetical protein